MGGAELTVSPLRRPSFYLLTAVDQAQWPAVEVIRRRLNQGFWGLERTARYLADFRVGDQCCFYAAKSGVVAHAEVAGLPKVGIVASEALFGVLDATRFRLPMKPAHTLGQPLRLTADVRAGLDAFRGRDPTRQWGWFVQTTTKLTARDFAILTRTEDRS